MTSPDIAQQAWEATAQARKLMLDRATEWLDRFILAMRQEGITDEVCTRVVNRILTGWPDPDEVIRPADAAARSRIWLSEGVPPQWETGGGPQCH